jgi:hypothetical protein
MGQAFALRCHYLWLLYEGSNISHCLFFFDRLAFTGFQKHGDRKALR